MQRLNRTLLLTAALAGILTAASAEAVSASTRTEEATRSDDDRMAGSSPISNEAPEAPKLNNRPPKEHSTAAERPPSKADPAPVLAPEPEAPGTLRQDFSEIEPIGLIDEGVGGGLGEDVWYGSDRDFITARMLEAPRITYFPIVQDLLRRLYLTSAKSDYFNRNGNRPEPGRDMLTVRLEKLEQMGLYQEAIKLYSQIVDEPYHEKLARAGVLSMMQGGKGSLGCLETRTVMNRFGELEFWQTLNAVCDVAMGRLVPRKGIVPDHAGLEVNDIDLGGSGSKILEQLSRRKNFMYSVRSQEDIEALSPIERAALQTNEAFVFDRFRFNGRAPVSPATFGVVLGNRSINESMHFTVLARAASYGLKPVSAIQEEYDLFKNNTREKPVGWRQMATFYRLATNTDPGPEQSAMLAGALSLGRSYGGAYALTPFADMLTAADPASFSQDMTADAVRIMLATSRTVPPAWLNRLSQGVSDRNSLLLFIAAELNSDLSTESKVNIAALQNLFGKLSPLEKTLISAAYEKLDKTNKLHNYTSAEAYEKLIDLTRNADYVMPSSDLTGRLSLAFQEKRLGESILLSAIALQGAQPGSVNPGLLQEIIGGWKTVGLTKEARALATEVILGLSH